MVNIASLGKCIKKIRKKIRKYYSDDSKPIFNVCLEGLNNHIDNKRALLSYITHPFHISPNTSTFYHNNIILMAHTIVSCLNKMGYIVDVVNFNDRDFHPRNKYDLFIGHGCKNFESICNILPENIPCIYFSSTSYWKFNNDKELERIEDLKQRIATDYLPERLLSEKYEISLRRADLIISLGNSVIRNTFPKNLEVKSISNVSYGDVVFPNRQKDYAVGRNHFLYFAGLGPVHKGLDLLLESFSSLPHKHLWICTKLNEEFIDIYKKQLFEYPNIHFLGWIENRSRLFYEIMSLCDFSILPTCSEGCAGSVVESMNQGLIPIISPYAGITIEDFGFYLPTCSITEICDVINQAGDLSVRELERMSIKSYQHIQEFYSKEQFEIEFTKILKSILDYQ